MDADVVLAAAILETHRSAGTHFRAAGVGSFVRQAGDGEPVVLMHGLPASSFLYRKVIPELAARGFRALSFDWPGLGLADRPTHFDYTISGIGRWAAAAIDALGLDQFHLVVHDAGGPVGFELALRLRERIRSLTILNTMVELPKAPFPGEMLARFSTKGFDHLPLGLGRLITSPWAWQQMLYRVGVWNRAALSMPEILVWRELALGSNNGATYLQIMSQVRKGHESRRWAAVIDARQTPYPVSIGWGGYDPMLSIRDYGLKVQAATHLPSFAVLPGRHFLQEDCAPQVAALIAENAANAVY
ncbi:MAG: alpha/beta hydrolase [Anaerolineales bacterium]|nr:alpha/beta hydrolase [Anaerolineales bacterium]